MTARLLGEAVLAERKRSIGAECSSLGMVASRVIGLVSRGAWNSRLTRAGKHHPQLSGQR